MATIDTIRQYFADILQRSGPEVTAAEIDAYVSSVDSGVLTLAQIRSTMIDSPEGQDVQAVVRIYQTVFGRVPDKQGLNDQVDDLRGPATVSDITNSFANSPEFISRFGSNTVSPVFIVAVYQQVLGRTPSAGEIGFYMDSGFSAGRITLAFSESPEFQNAYSASVVAFLHAAGEGTADYTGALGKTLNVGEFTLTQGTDAGAAFVGTDGDDVYNGAVEQTPFLPIQTLTDGDDLDGMGGRDTLNAGLTNIFTAPAGLNGIEIVNLSAPAALFGAGIFTPTLDLANADSVDTLGFRGFSNGATINNLTTALTDINVADILPNPLVLGGLGDITVNHTGAALDGTEDSVNVNARNVGGTFGGLTGPLGIVLTTTSGGADAGYETINIDSTGAPNWIEVVGSATEATKTVNITGDAELDVNHGDSGAPFRTWDAETLDLINAAGDGAEVGPFTGDLYTTVAGMGAVEVRGGEGENDLTFGEDVDATAVGGSQNDIFRFASDGEDASFDEFDSVDGAGGDDDILEIEADEDELLLTGVGANIVGVETIQHVTEDPITGVEDGLNGDLSVDMSRSGSATTLVLAGLYDEENVEVTELTNEDWVVYRPGLATGGIDEDILDLTLMHANPIGLSDHINLRMDSQQTAGEENEFEDDLIIDAGVELLNLDSIGEDGAEDNNIDDADDLDVDIIITGDHDLEIGVDGPAYDFANGVVDAEAFTGDLEIHLGENSQTVSVGTGDDYVEVENSSATGADIINLAPGGEDTVRFVQETEDASDTIQSGAYHSVLGFSLADDLIEFDEDNVDSGTLSFTTGGDVGPGSIISILEMSSNETANGALQSYNFIKFVDAIETATFPGAPDDINQAFDEAIGTGSVINVGGGDEFLASLYDASTQQMVLFTVDAGGNIIDDIDDVDVITTVGMSFADYEAFDGTNIAFV